MESHPIRAVIVWDGRVFQGRCSRVFFFSFPTYCVGFCPCAKMLSEIGAHPRGSCCCSSKLCQTQLCPLLFAIHLLLVWDFSCGSRELILRAHVHACSRGDCKSVMPSPQRRAARGCQSAGEWEEQCIWAGAVQVIAAHGGFHLCSLLAQCSCWSWERKPTFVISIWLFCMGRRSEGEMGYKLCVFLGSFKKYIWFLFFNRSS